MRTLKEIRQKNKRNDLLDDHEKSERHLKNAEAAYLEIADLYEFKVIECVFQDKIKTVDDISNELYESIINEIL
jgi:dTMP kinase